jgi:hypothetical protein
MTRLKSKNSGSFAQFCVRALTMFGMPIKE